MRLHDTRLQAVVDILPARQGVLTISACGPTLDRDADARDLRTFVLADLIRRTAALAGLQVVVVMTIADVVSAVPAVARRHEERFDRDLAALNVYPADHVLRSRASVDIMGPTLVGTTIDVHVGGIDAGLPHHDVVRHWVQGADLLFDDPSLGLSAGNAPRVCDVIDRGIDPLALRLAFLQSRYGQQLNVTWASLAAADTLLTRWRTAVAEWATRPSVAMPARMVAAIATALDDDLDTPRLLLLLHDLERALDVPDGAKFEVFAYVDRALGLDLARTIGHAPPAATTDGPPAEGT